MYHNLNGNALFYLVYPARFERATSASGGLRSSS
jgi:hypothetical protein